jgi:hypothetical protein
LPDGETSAFAGRRTTLDVREEGRRAIEVISDVCRSGRLSIPFQYEGKYSIVPFREFTEEELDNCVVFSDYGSTRNIHFTGPQAVEFTATPDDKLTNEITMTFEESRNFDIPRPIVGNDPDQQYKASKILGDESLSVVPAQFNAYGVRAEQEAIKLLYHHLWFGPSESGGTKNNCFAKFIVPFEHTLGMRRYDPFRLDLATQTIPTGPTGVSQIETQTAAGTCSGSGNMTVTITAAEFTAPVVVSVAVLNADTPAVWVKKVVTALKATATVNALFFIRFNSTSLILKKRFHGANDATLNIAFATGTATGITTAASSANTLSGVADSTFEWFRLLDVKKIDNGLAEINGIAYNREAYEDFETESVSPPTPGFCTLDADCPTGFVCRDGVCVPEGPGPTCRPGPAVITYDTAKGSIVAAVPPC